MVYFAASMPVGIIYSQVVLRPISACRLFPPYDAPRDSPVLFSCVIINLLVYHRFGHDFQSAAITALTHLFITASEKVMFFLPLCQGRM